MEDYKSTSSSIKVRAAERALNLPKFTLIGATTRAGMISGPCVRALA